MPDRQRLSQWLAITALIAMAFGNLLVLWNTRVRMREGYGDFSSFYAAGVLVRRGLGHELYNPAAVWKVQQEFAAGVNIRQGPLPYIRPPFEALLFALFAAWPYSKALLLWTGFKLLLLAIIPFFVIGGRPHPRVLPALAVGPLLLGTFPEFMDLLMGQDATFLLLLFAISFRLLAAKKNMVAGFTLGLALFKFQLVFPFVVMVWIAGNRKVLRGFVISGFGVVLISVLIVGWRGLFDYPAYLLELNRSVTAGMITPHYQVNLRGLLTLVVGRSAYPGFIHLALIPSAIVGCVCAGLIWRRAEGSLLAEGYGLALVVAIVTSYYAYDYDMLLLAVPIMAIFARGEIWRERNAVLRYIENAGLVLILIAPLYWFLRERLEAECLMAIPLTAVGIGFARRLRGGDRAKGADAGLFRREVS